VFQFVFSVPTNFATTASRSDPSYANHGRAAPSHVELETVQNKLHARTDWIDPLRNPFGTAGPPRNLHAICWSTVPSACASPSGITARLR